jgi:hypothetical protein
MAFIKHQYQIKMFSLNNTIALLITCYSSYQLWNPNNMDDMIKEKRDIIWSRHINNSFDSSFEESLSYYNECLLDSYKRDLISSDESRKLRYNFMLFLSSFYMIMSLLL